MSENWIKLRPSILHDPKMIRMSRVLYANPQFEQFFWVGDGETEHIVPDAEETGMAFSIRGTLNVYARAQEFGVPVGPEFLGQEPVKGPIDESGPNDYSRPHLVMFKTDVRALDKIAGIPGVGESMLEVGIAVYDGDRDCMIFPKFFIENQSPLDRKRRLNADRQKRFRDRTSKSKLGPDSDANITLDQSRKEADLEESIIETNILGIGSCPYSKIIKAWNESCGEHGTVNPTEANGHLKRLIKKRWNSVEGDISEFLEVFRYISEIEFLKHGTEDGWEGATLRWTLNDENWEKLKNKEY